jgi:retron-type reverse transcriptase
MEKMNIHPKLRCLVKQTLTNTSFKVITKYGLTEEIKTTRGLKQGDPLSPTLFNIFINPILDYLNETGKGFRLWVKEIKVLAFADNIALISETKEGVVDMLDKLSECLDDFGMKINNTKSALCINDRDRRTP